MMAPPIQGDPYENLPDNQTNPGSTGALAAWNYWRLYGGTVLDQALTELTSLPFWNG